MNFDLICDYYTMEEVRERWRLKPNSLMLTRAVMCGLLKPCLWVPESELQVVHVDAGGRPDTSGGDAVRARVGGWLYPWHAFQVQTAPFAALFPVLSNSASFPREGNLFCAESPISLEMIFSNGVVMASDLRASEEEVRRGEREELHTKEENTILRILSATLADCFRFNPHERSDFAGHISRAGKRYGINVSDGSVLKYARRAFDEYPPDYGAAIPEER